MVEDDVCILHGYCSQPISDKLKDMIFSSWRTSAGKHWLLDGLGSDICDVTQTKVM
jgi:hypothetical protein